MSWILKATLFFNNQLLIDLSNKKTIENDRKQLFPTVFDRFRFMWHFKKMIVRLMPNLLKRTVALIIKKQHRQHCADAVIITSPLQIFYRIVIFSIEQESLV
jgi:hypothetical protein